MFATGISPDTQTVLESLAELSFVKKYYLAGGTACALYYGHRLSYDLDFFSSDPVDPTAISHKLENLGKLEIQQASEGTWLGSINQVKLSFFEHLYPLVGEENEWASIRIASKLDIGCMKLEAIGSRGIMRDFVDMYLLSKELGLDAIIDAARQKYSATNYSELHFLRALTYFEDADMSIPPTMLVDWEWNEVKRYFESEVKRLSKKWGI